MEHRTWLKETYNPVRRLAKRLWLEEVAIQLLCTICREPLVREETAPDAMEFFLRCSCRIRKVRK